MSKENDWLSNKKKSDWVTSATPLPEWAKSTPTVDLGRTAIVPGSVFKRKLDELANKVNKAVQPGAYEVKDQDDYLQKLREVLIEVGNAFQDWKGGVGATANLNDSYDPSANGWLHTPWLSTKAADEDSAEESEKEDKAPEVSAGTKEDAKKLVVDAIAKSIADTASGGSAAVDSATGSRSVSAEWMEGAISKYLPLEIGKADLRDAVTKALTAAGVSVSSPKSSPESTKKEAPKSSPKSKREEEGDETKDSTAEKGSQEDEGGEAGFRDPKPKHKSIAPTKKMPGVKKPRPPKLRFIQ